MDTIAYATRASLVNPLFLYQFEAVLHSCIILTQEQFPANVSMTKRRKVN